MSTITITVSESIARDLFQILEKYTSILHVIIYPIIIVHFSDVSLRESIILINVIRGKGITSLAKFSISVSALKG